MRNISRFLIAVFIITTNFGCVRAQNGLKKLTGSSPAERADYQTRLMQDKLKLSDAQVIKVKAINLKYAQKFQPIIESKDSPADKAKLAGEIFDKKNKELQTVFTKDQFTKYMLYVKKIQSRMIERMKK